MKILLTGAAGFLGSHLLEALLPSGHFIIGLDDLSTGNRNNISNFLNHKNFKFYEADIRTPLEEKIDLILNFACPASPRQYQVDPVKTIETNFLGALNMLKLAKNNGASLLQASTSEIYGDPMISPQSEDYWGNVNPIGLRSCYDEGKRSAETLCFDFKRQYNLKIKVIRIFNTYGPKMDPDDGRVISNFINQALRNEDITIYGNGIQTRSFCYVSDLISAINRFVFLDFIPETPINLGNPEEITIENLALKIIELTNSKSKLIKMDLPEDDPKKRKPDISKAIKLLDWKPTISLEEGLKQTINYFKHNLK